MRKLIEALDQFTEEFKMNKGSKKVIDAFLDKKPADNKKLFTDGKVLEGLWIGGRDIAKWENGKIVMPQASGRAV